MSDRVNLPPEAEAAGLVGSHFVPETRSPEKANGAAPVGRIIKTSAEFVAEFEPPDYLIDGLLQRRFLYSLTDKPAAAKPP